MGLRVVVKKQKDLWEEGLRAGRLFAMQKQRDLADGVKASRRQRTPTRARTTAHSMKTATACCTTAAALATARSTAAASGASTFAHRTSISHHVERYGGRFVALGEVLAIRRGINSGCDAFFMPRDVSPDFLEKHSVRDWNDAPLFAHCKRSEVESGEVKLVEAGDGTVHPVESIYLAPEIHSLMNVSSPTISARRARQGRPACF